ncbi:hypothetical protein [Microbacterium sp. SLBN-154]|uniref:hypothetical protein n=1 Tax=Microbacterium sp. SLBN-154 TaxID=2768458 RepID=UPI00135B5F30|nr:hypothetical protein [Microbacterium sp. SLBN-154]
MTDNAMRDFARVVNGLSSALDLQGDEQAIARYEAEARDAFDRLLAESGVAEQR